MQAILPTTMILRLPPSAPVQNTCAGFYAVVFSSEGLPIAVSTTEIRRSDTFSCSGHKGQILVAALPGPGLPECGLLIPST